MNTGHLALLIVCAVCGSYGTFFSGAVFCDIYCCAEVRALRHRRTILPLPSIESYTPQRISLERTPIEDITSKVRAVLVIPPLGQDIYVGIAKNG